VQFGVLGPMQVIAGESGEPGTISAARLRALLAALLWRAGQPVATDELAELVWDGAPPGGAAAAIRALVMRLRRRLGERAAARIVARAPGYAIEVDRDELDALQFEALAQEAGAAVRAGRWAQGVRAGAGALGLWRGAPLADVPSQLLRDLWVPRLEQLHVQALDCRIQGDLHEGRHELLIPELRDLTARHPLRENFHGQLMLALYRCGRQAEALAAYQHARDALAEELGIDPGPGLRDLHQRMLSADPALAVTGPARSGPGEPQRVAPRELPSAVPGFTGRLAELGALTGLLDGPGEHAPGAIVIAAIGGTAGVGKTALAVHWAHQAAARFPDGQLYMNLRGYDPGQLVSAGDALAGFLRSLGVPGQEIPADQDERAARYRSLLAGRRMLVVLDNAQSADQVRPLLPGSPACAVVVTSRDALPGLVSRDGAIRLDLDVLPQEEAVALLRTLIGARVDAEPQAAAELAEQCARLPLALRVAAELAASRQAVPLASLVDELGGLGTRLNLLTANGDSSADVRTVLSWSYRHLDAADARTFRLLGLHPGPDWDPYAVAALAGTTVQQARQALGVLVRAHVIQPTSPGRYGMHDLLRGYAREIAETEDDERERRAAIRRALDHYLLTAHAAARLFLPDGQPPPLPETSAGVGGVPLADQEQARAWCRAEQAVLRAAVSLAADSRFAAHAWQLAWSIAVFPEQCRRWREQVATGQIALAAAEQTGDQAGQAYAHRHLGNALFAGGRPAEARDHLQRALALFGQSGDRISRADTELALGETLCELGQPARALARSQRSLKAYQAAGHDSGRARALNDLGWCHLMLGSYEQGLAICQDAIELILRADNPSLRYLRAATLDSIGYAHHHLGRYLDAVASYQEALRVYESAGEIRLQATTLDRLGDTYYAAADPAAARDAWKQAAAILDDVRHPAAEQTRAKIATTNDS
jgi:DNA-binding SARP family transcriptional activator